MPTSSSPEHPAAADTKSKVSRPKRDRRRVAGGSVTSSGSQCTVSTSANSADDLSNPVRDLVARIYEEELRKLMSAAELNGNVIDARTYEREIKRLSYLRDGSTVPKPPCKSLDSGVAEDKENKENGVPSATVDDTVPAEDMPEDLSVGRPKATGDVLACESLIHADTGLDDAVGCAMVNDGLSPLQRMQCIANSLPSTAVTQSVAGAASSRQGLPPITAEQMAACEEMDTDDIVAKVNSSMIALRILMCSTEKQNVSFYK